MRKVVNIIFIISLVLSLSACSDNIIWGYEHPDFVTQYTAEEHVERIRQRTAEKFETEILNGDIVGVNVEIVYAFYDDDPEYFLVELEFYKEWKSFYEANNMEEVEYTTKYKHLIGYIHNDKYYAGLKYYDSNSFNNVEKLYGFIDGKSSYSYYGYEDSKKYYGASAQGVLVEDEIIELAYATCLQDGIIESHDHISGQCPAGEVISPSKYEKLMKGNKKMYSREY